MAFDLLLFLFNAWVFSELVFASNVSKALPNCRDKCGDVDIPYPFGIDEGCYKDNGKQITCNKSFDPPRPFIGKGNIQIKRIDLSTAQMEVFQIYIGTDCYDNEGNRTEHKTTTFTVFPYRISTVNKFISIGCDTYGYFNSIIGERRFSMGCISRCNESEIVTNGSCSGIGCCQVPIPRNVSRFGLGAYSFNNHSFSKRFNPCSFSFLVEESAYKFDIRHLLNESNVLGTEGLPVILDWSIGNQTCNVAKQNPSTFACKENSDCSNSTNIDGYFCTCKKGFEGNPYLKAFEGGCEDIDECQRKLHECEAPSKCVNEKPEYRCRCPRGYRGREDGKGCERVILIIILVTALSCLFVSTVCGSLYWIYNRRKLIKMRQKFFKQNGGMLLEQHISLYSGAIKTPEILTSEELKKATKNYHESHILGEGGFGVVYKGILPQGKVVAIKKSKITEKAQVVQFINEVSILSQIDHKNVVKLIGCCLDTPVPMLVYEFIAGGTLYHHIHDKGFSSSLSWKERVRIASETADALAHLHSIAPMPIFHRDIKSQNILLDENYTVKVSDFGASRSVPFDRTHITTVVQGTWGYLDPEYFHSSQLTDKSDVYSFGIVLLELLTGELPISPEKPPDERHLAVRFISSMKENRLKEMLASRVVEEGKEEEIFMVAELVRRCLEMKGEDRPDMKNIALDLQKLRIQQEHPWSSQSTEETQYLLGEYP